MDASGNHHLLRRIPLDAQRFSLNDHPAVPGPDLDKRICVEQNPSVIFYVYLAVSHKAHEHIPQDHIPWQAQGGNSRSL